MRLEKLAIRYWDFGANEGRYTGAAEFVGSPGKIELNLSPQQCQRIFEVLGDALIETARESAQLLTVAIIEHKNALDVQGAQT